MHAVQHMVLVKFKPDVSSQKIAELFGQLAELPRLISGIEQFTESISFDHRLAKYDIAGSIAHARMLAEVGLMSDAEAKQITETLERIGREIEAGSFEFRADREDIHMHIEWALIERLGEVG